MTNWDSRPLEVKELRGVQLVEVVEEVTRTIIAPPTKDIELPFEGDSSMSLSWLWDLTSVVVVLFELHGGGVEHPEVLFGVKLL